MTVRRFGRGTGAPSLLTVLFVLSCARVHAAPLFMDTFESGDFRAWDSYPFSDVEINRFECTAEAAHSGSWGFRFTDANGSYGDRVEGQLDKAIRPRGSVYLRYWFRYSATARGVAWLSRFIRNDYWHAPGDVTLEADGSLTLGGDVGFGHYVTEETDVVLEQGRWYLIELSTTGLGTNQGRRALWVDGQSIAQSTGLDFVNARVERLVIGEPWTWHGAFRGTLDFDDVYVDTSPLPSHFDVAPPKLVQSEACVPLVVSLLDSVAKKPAAAPYDVTGTLTVSASGAAFYSDVDCTSATTTVRLEAGAASGTVYFKATAAGNRNLSVAAFSTDFLKGQRQITVQPAPPKLDPLGARCSQAAQCESGFCADGVCCDRACDAGPCEACSVRARAAVDGICQPLPPTTTCRPSSGNCDPEERCTGMSGECPVDTLASSETVCRSARGLCDVPELCTGESVQCPEDVLASSETVCRLASSTEPAAYCTGESVTCPDVNGLPSLPGNPPPETAERSGFDCSTPDCIEAAELGCSCGTSAGAALPFGLAGVLVLKQWMRRRRREARFESAQSPFDRLRAGSSAVGRPGR